MTLNDLKNDISSLGFEREIALDNNFVNAVRRALATIYTERGVYKKITILHFPKRPHLILKSFTHKMNETVSFRISGHAYSFTVCGKGSYKVEENGVSTVHDFNTPHGFCCGFISSEATITFMGKYAYFVLNFAAFDEITSDNKESLFAYGEPFVYKMSEKCDDFHSFSSMATDEYGCEIRGASLYGETVEVPWNYDGAINLTYKAAAPKISIDSAQEDFFVPKESEHLISLLAASYYWLDDDTEKAEYYLLLYREALESARKYDTRRINGAGFQNVTGWI
jgi:hypothetical protein